MTPVRGRYGIVRWTGPRPVDHEAERHDPRGPVQPPQQPRERQVHPALRCSCGGLKAAKAKLCLRCHLAEVKANATGPAKVHDCAECGDVCPRNHKLCWDCRVKAAGKTCQDCGVPVGPKATWCRSCSGLRTAGSLASRRWADKPERHGDNAGFRRHKVAGEEPCAECREGRNAYLREKRAAKKKVAA